MLTGTGMAKKKKNQNFSLKICSVTLLSTFWVKWADMSMMRKSWKIHFYFISFIGMLYFSNVHWKVMETVILESLLCEWPNNKTLHYRFTDQLQVVLLELFFFKQELFKCILNKDKKTNQTTPHPHPPRYQMSAFLCEEDIHCNSFWLTSLLLFKRQLSIFDTKNVWNRLIPLLFR